MMAAIDVAVDGAPGARVRRWDGDDRRVAGVERDGARDDRLRHGRHALAHLLRFQGLGVEKSAARSFLLFNKKERTKKIKISVLLAHV